MEKPFEGKKIGVSIEHRFFKFKGEYYDNSVYDRSFWDPYIKIFNKIYIIARAREIHELSDDYRRVNINGVEFLELQDYSLNPKTFPAVLINIYQLKKIVNKIDGVIFRSPSFMGSFLWLWVRYIKMPYSVELVGDIQDIAALSKTKLEKYFRKYFYTPIVKMQCQKANLVSYVTEKYLQKKYPNRVASNMISWSTIQLNLNDIFTHSRTFHDKLTYRFIYTASFVPYKGHDLLIELFSNLIIKKNDLELFLIGDGPLKPTIEEKVKALNLQSNIKFLGNLSNNEVGRTLKCADIYITTSLTEGLPRSVIEAAAKALPVFGFDVGGIPEIVGRNCLVEKLDIAKLETLILDALDNPEYLNKASKYNRERAFYYSVENTFPKRLKSYSRLLEQIN